VSHRPTGTKELPADGARPLREADRRHSAVTGAPPSKRASSPPAPTKAERARPPLPPTFLCALPPLLTTDEVATFLRTSRQAVYAMAARRQLPGLTRVGRRLLVRRDDLLSWLDERRAASPGGTRR
jgi:excisionase family DNA binding protein